jgi:hypothetical protein
VLRAVNWEHDGSGVLLFHDKAIPLLCAILLYVIYCRPHELKFQLVSIRKCLLTLLVLSIPIPMDYVCEIIRRNVASHSRRQIC